MKSENSRTVQPLGAGFILFVASVLNSSAVTFTTDTLIRFDNTNYDGQDIVVTNCTLTIDGHHSFASIRLLMRGVLTHSFAESGLLTNSLNIGPDPFVLSAMNAAALLMGAVPSTVVVTDLTGSTQFVAGSDYAITSQSPYSLILVPGSRIPEGASVLVNYVVERPPVPTGLDLQIENDMEITPGGTINVYGRGYAGLSGPGAARELGGCRGDPARHFPRPCRKRGAPPA